MKSALRSHTLNHPADKSMEKRMPTSISNIDFWHRVNSHTSFLENSWGIIRSVTASVTRQFLLALSYTSRQSTFILICFFFHAAPENYDGLFILVVLLMCQVFFYSLTDSKLDKFYVTCTQPDAKGLRYNHVPIGTYYFCLYR